MTVQSPADLLQEAAAAAAESRYWDAVQAYTDLLSLTNPRTDDLMIKEARAASLGERARLLRILGEQDASLAAYEQYKMEAHTPNHRIEALVHIGRIQQDMGRHQSALATCEEAAELAEKHNYLLGLANALSTKGYIFLVLGRSAQATDILNQANTFFEKSGSLVGQLDTLIYMGIAHTYNGHLDQAAFVVERALQMARHLELLDRVVVCLNNGGEVYQMLFDMERAYQYHLEALELLEKLQMRRLESDLCRNLGLELNYLGQKEAGIAYLERALVLSETTHNHSVFSPTLYALSLAELEQGHIDKARGYANRLHDVTKEEGSNYFLTQALDALARCEKKAGNIQKAQELWQEAIFLAHDTHQRVLLWQIHAGLAESVTDPDLQNVHRRIAREIIEQIAQPIRDENLRQTYLSAPPVHAVLQHS